jgi:hypothetical protein
MTKVKGAFRNPQLKNPACPAEFFPKKNSRALFAGV